MSPSRLTETLLLTSGALRTCWLGWSAPAGSDRHADPNDGRGVIVELTEAGRELADRAMPDHAAIERELVAMFRRREQRALAAMLSRMLVLNARRRRHRCRRATSAATRPAPHGRDGQLKGR